MILAIDAGNTHITLGVISSTRAVSHSMKLSTDFGKTAEEYAVLIMNVLSLNGIEAEGFSGAIISSSIPPLNTALMESARIITGKTPVLIGSGVKTGLNILLDDPGTVTGNLVATAVAVKEEYPLPAFIVEMDTATTVTAVNENGGFIGGAIMPGVGLSADALTKGTSLLPSVDLSSPKKTVGTNTSDAIKSGLIYGFAGAVDGIVDRFIAEIGEPASIVATGSMSPLVVPYCRHRIIQDPQLLLKGLGCIFFKNLSAQKNGNGRKK